MFCNALRINDPKPRFSSLVPPRERIRVKKCSFHDSSTLSFQSKNYCWWKQLHSKGRDTISAIDLVQSLDDTCGQMSRTNRGCGLVSHTSKSRKHLQDKFGSFPGWSVFLMCLKNTWKLEPQQTKASRTLKNGNLNKLPDGSSNPMPKSWTMERCGESEVQGKLKEQTVLAHEIEYCSQVHGSSNRATESSPQFALPWTPARCLSRNIEDEAPNATEMSLTVWLFGWS